MPKKKLTKRQVYKAYFEMGKKINILITDKLYHMDRHIPQSMVKLMEIHKALLSAKKRV